MPLPRAGSSLGRRLAVALLALAASGCGATDPWSVGEESQVDRRLAPYGIDLAAAEVSVALLGWQAPPPDCAHAYRLRASYVPAMRFEDDNEASLIVARHPRREPEPKHVEQPGPIAEDAMIPVHLFYQGIRAERIGATRDSYFTRHFVGPAAPTAACMPRTWDPMEDAFALGWPKLPGRLTATDERWAGLPVEGKCNRSACVDPESGGGGQDTHDRTCVTEPWWERLAGLFEHEGELYAWIESEWSDGQPEGKGISTTRRTLVSVDHGRPLWSQTVIDHRFGQPAKEGGFQPVVRTWTLESIDACAGSLAAAGWERPPGVVDEEVRLHERLADSESLRRQTRRADWAQGEQE